MSDFFTSLKSCATNFGKKMGSDDKYGASERGSESLYVSNLEPKKGIAMFIIDPQNDFMDEPAGALAVKGAAQDSMRTAAFILKNLHNIDEMFVSLDTHMLYHIAHPDFWVKQERTSANDEWSNDQVVPVFTQISRESLNENGVKDGDKFVRFKTSKPEMAKWGKIYTETLEKQSNLMLMIWPPHCLIGSGGHNVQSDIYKAIAAWESVHKKPTNYIIKGNNSMTEHYSAFKAEVVVDLDKATNFNHDAYKKLKAHDKVYVAGQARSHCVKHSVMHLTDMFTEEKIKWDKVVLLKGAMSDVGGFEADGEAFWKAMTEGEDPNKVCRAEDITNIPLPKAKWDTMLVEEMKAAVNAIPDSYLARNADNNTVSV